MSQASENSLRESSIREAVSRDSFGRKGRAFRGCSAKSAVISDKRRFFGGIRGPPGPCELSRSFGQQLVARGRQFPGVDVGVEGRVRGAESELPPWSLWMAALKLAASRKVCRPASR